MHIVLLVLFLVWAGTSAFGSIHLPDPQVLLYGVAVGRRARGRRLRDPARSATRSRDRLVPVAASARSSGLFAVVRRPTNIALLLGGSVVVTFGYIVAMYFSTQAFGGDLSLRAGRRDLPRRLARSRARRPRPAASARSKPRSSRAWSRRACRTTIAVPSVFLFRLGTFWLPILPGWGAFTYMQREDYL